MSLARTEDGFEVYTLYIGDIPKSFTEEILHNHFSRYGELTSVEIRFSDDKIMRYALINFKNAESATEALSIQPHDISVGINIEQKYVKVADSWWQPNFENEFNIESDSLIMMLNDDCLIHIFSFLSTRERIKLCRMNERFKQIFNITNIRNKTVSLLNLTLMEIRYICREFGQFIKKINLECLSADSLYLKYKTKLLNIQSERDRLYRLGQLNRAPKFIAQYCCELRSLHFENLRIGEYTKFRLLKNLTKITLRNCDITDDVCFHLSKLQNINHLDLGENCKLTGKYLKDFPKLTHLNLSDCNGINQYQIFIFCSSNTIIDNLKSLNLKSFRLRPNIFAKLTSFKNLESLVITSTIEFGLLSQIKKLKHLIIYVKNPRNRFQQSTDQCFPELETLFVIGSNILPASVRVTKNYIFLMKTLKKLAFIYCCDLGDEDMLTISAMPELTYFSLSGCTSITLNAFLKLFKKTNKLQHIDISETRFSYNYVPPFCPYETIRPVDVLRKKIAETGKATTIYLEGKEFEEFLPWTTILKKRSVFPGMKLRPYLSYEFTD